MKNNISWAVLLVLLIVVLRLPNKTSGYMKEYSPKKVRNDIKRINRAFKDKKLNNIKEFENALRDVNTKNLKITDEQKRNDTINRINMIRGDLSTQPVESKSEPVGMPPP